MEGSASIFLDKEFIRYSPSRQVFEAAGLATDLESWTLDAVDWGLLEGRCVKLIVYYGFVLPYLIGGGYRRNLEAKP